MDYFLLWFRFCKGFRLHQVVSSGAMLPEQAFRRLPRAGASPCTPLNINLFRMGWAVGSVLGMMATSRRRSIGGSLKMDFAF